MGQGRVWDGPSAAYLFLTVIACSGLTLAFYAFLGSGGLRAQAYLDHASVLAAVVAEPRVLARFLVLSLLPLPFVARTSWRRLELPPLLRVVPIVAAGMITWILLSAAPNFWSGYTREFDHAVLLVTFCLFIWHPAFVGLFCALAFCLFNELTAPIGQFWISEKGVVLDQLIALMAYLLFVGATKKPNPWLYVVLSVSIQLQHYFWAGMTKVVLGQTPWDWAVNNQTADLTLQSAIKGHNPLPLDLVLPYIEWANSLYWLPNSAVLLFQLLTVLFFVHRTVGCAVMAGAALLHIGIAFCTGIFFWEWLVLSLAFEAMLIGLRRPGYEPQSFNRMTLIFSVALVLTTPFWHRPHYLGWFDEPITNMVRVEAVTTDGTVYTIAPNDFAPYDRRFNYDEDFFFLINMPLIAEFPPEIVREIRALKNATEFRRYQEGHGTTFRDEQKGRTFELFMRRYLTNADMRGGIFRTALPQAPPHLLYWRSQEPRFTKAQAHDVRALRVRFTQYSYLGGKLEQVHEFIAHEFIPRPMRSPEP